MSFILSAKPTSVRCQNPNVRDEKGMNMGEMKGRKREKKRRQWGEEEEYIRFLKFRFMKLNFDDLLQNTETKILARFKEY